VDGCGVPNGLTVARTRHLRVKSPKTISNARQLLGTNVRPVIRHVWVDRTSRACLEDLFADMAARNYATSTIDRTWGYLNQACQFAQREPSSSALRRRPTRRQAVT
jgi:hypothetical protein